MCCRETDPIKLVDNINEGLVEVDEWLKANRISLNVDKSSYMLFSNNLLALPRRITMRGHYLEKVSSAKFLGIYIDDRLTFSSHIQNVSNKIAKCSGIINKLSMFMPHEVIKRLYSSLVVPHLIYGIEVWGKGNVTDINYLSRIQDRCVKLVNRGNPATLAVYKYYNLFTVKQIHCYFVLSRFYRYIVQEEVPIL